MIYKHALAAIYRVFISSSHDSPEHRQRVLALTNQLRKDGVEAWIDQYIQDPNEGWIRWMRSQVKQANRILLVFTETYQRRSEGDEEEGKGLGATYEGAIVTQALYESGGRNAKFRPVVFREEDKQFIPSGLRQFSHYRVDTPENYEALLRWLHEAPRIVVPIVSQKPDLPPEPAPELFPSPSHEPRASAPEAEASLPKRPRSRLRSLAREPLRREAAQKLKQIDIRDAKHREEMFLTHDWLAGPIPKLKPTYATISQKYIAKEKRIGDPTGLILVDEADRLKIVSLEQMRAIFDAGCRPVLKS